MIGWIWEVLLNLFIKGTLYNAGVLYGPWLPIYGVVSILIYIICSKVKNDLGIFVFTFCTTGVIEYFTSMALEHIYHRRWWDYSNFIFNFNGRTSLEALTFFSIMAILAKKYIFNFFMKTYIKINGKVFNWILLTVCALFIVDLIYVFVHSNILVIPPEYRHIINIISPR